MGLPDFDSVVARAKAQICEDVLSGRVHCDVHSFAELHDYVDANEYGGLMDSEDVFDPSDEACAFWNNVQDTLHDWIASGAMRREAAAIERQRELEG